MMPSNTNTNPALEEGVDTQMNDEQPEKNRNKEKRRGRPGRKRKQTMVFSFLWHRASCVQDNRVYMRPNQQSLKGPLEAATIKVDINEASSEMVAAPKCQSSQESSAQVHNGDVESNQQNMGNSQQFGERSVPGNGDHGKSALETQNLKDQESNEESTSLDGDIEIDLEMENGCYTPKGGQDSEKGEIEKVPSALRKKYKKRQLEAAEKVTFLLWRTRERDFKGGVGVNWLVDCRHQTVGKITKYSVRRLNFLGMDGLELIWKVNLGLGIPFYSGLESKSVSV